MEFYVLAYDISDDRRRQKVAKLCESLAQRVQGSVFEAHLEKKDLERLIKKALRLMDEKEDSLRIYTLCLACCEKVRMFGQGKKTEAPQLMIV